MVWRRTQVAPRGRWMCREGGRLATQRQRLAAMVRERGYRGLLRVILAKSSRMKSKRKSTPIAWTGRLHRSLCLKVDQEVWVKEVALPTQQAVILQCRQQG